MKHSESQSEYWREFLTTTGRDTNLKCNECFYFGSSEQIANELLELVLAGTKRATASSFFSYEINNEELPKQGDLSIVTDWSGNPRCVIETLAVSIIPFKDITFDICKREGEDDCLESWQSNHVKFFTNDGNTDGYDFSWDMPVVFQDFKVIYTT